ncbi:MAG TPA: redox-regulated ATPase YchF [Clostridiales bacterium]|nr:MAG: redox-regulated ATPase YchF [Clostridiales bacterium GWD2_32_19]HCC07718.1 redox-regulated ATPase YchF [Clostridiales bacterium]
MKLGIVGLPNVGKSTLFNCLTNSTNAEAANYPFCTIDPNVGIAQVLDERLEKLKTLYKSQKTLPAIVEFVDIAGLVKGASKGEGLGNKFLSHIREVDAVLQVVRCFEDSNITHVDGSVNPARDIETINLELIFSDLEIVDKRIPKAEKGIRLDRLLAKEFEMLKRLKAALEKGIFARDFETYDNEELDALETLNLLTYKPVIYAANVNEEDLTDDGVSNSYVQSVKDLAAKENSKVFVICAKIEEELAGMELEEKKEFLSELGLSSSGLDKLIVASYDLLGLMSFLTAGVKEIRAWTIKKGSTGPQAAGKIHSDFEKGFIRAEVVKYNDLINLGSYVAAKEKGLVRMEGKTYIVQDGDVIEFHFND